MSRAPDFSVILATWNRGRHILPTLASVLAQSEQDFEVLVIGDHCTDDTGLVLKPYLSDTVRWINLQERGGSQSFANNAGLAIAQGKFIAYLGHDDIWARDHLAHLRSVFERQPDTGFAVSGCLIYGARGSDYFAVSGLFEDDEAKFEHHFPPSSFAHRATVTDRVGLWRAPNTIRAHPDADFLLRAANAGIKFCSTRCITVHKFAGWFRYLSYLAQSSEEQAECLERLSRPDAHAFLDEAVARAHACGGYMTMRHPDYAGYRVGDLARSNTINKGLGRLPLRPLEGSACLAQSDEWRGHDWHEPETSPYGRFRWSGPSPSPRILIPFSSQGRALFELDAVHAVPAYFDDLEIEINGDPVDWRIDRAPGGMHRIIVFSAPLKAADYSIITLKGRTAIAADFAGNLDRRRLGVAIGDVRLSPKGFARP